VSEKPIHTQPEPETINLESLMVRTESPELKSTSDRKEKHSSNKKKSSASSPAGRKISFEQGEMNKDLA